MKDLEKIDKKIRDLEQQKKALIQYETIQKRKERTRRLIQTGALCEKYFEIENLSIEQREKFFKYFCDFIKKNKPDFL